MQFSIPHDHPSLPGHFPGRPIVPGVVMLERVLEAIELTHVYDVVGLTRQEMIFDKSKLLRIYDETVKNEPM